MAAGDAKLSSKVISVSTAESLPNLGDLLAVLVAIGIIATLAVLTNTGVIGTPPK